MTNIIERKLRSYENKVQRKICGLVFYVISGENNIRELYEMLYMRPITNFIKNQRIQWLGYIMIIIEIKQKWIDG